MLFNMQGCTRTNTELEKKIWPDVFNQLWLYVTLSDVGQAMGQAYIYIKKDTPKNGGTDVYTWQNVYM